MRFRMKTVSEFIAHDAQIDADLRKPFAHSSKMYIQGSRPDLHVPMRKIEQADTPTQGPQETNPPVYIYDTSGPYTDPEASIDIRVGLPPLRSAWIEERGDTELLNGYTSDFS